jgi:hypothetical protein
VTDGHPNVLRPEDYPPGRWESLGLALAARRRDLGYRRQVDLVRAHASDGGVSDKIIRAMERGYREPRAMATIIRVARMYELAWDAIPRYLAGEGLFLAVLEDADPLAAIGITREDLEAFRRVLDRLDAYGSAGRRPRGAAG